MKLCKIMDRMEFMEFYGNMHENYQCRKCERRNGRDGARKIVINGFCLVSNMGRTNCFKVHCTQQRSITIFSLWVIVSTFSSHHSLYVYMYMVIRATRTNWIELTSIHVVAHINSKFIMHTENYAKMRKPNSPKG